MPTIDPSELVPVTPVAPAKSEPLPVRLADQLPMIGQFGGDVAGAVAAGSVAETGVGALAIPAAAAFGGGMGAWEGEKLRDVVRKHYGLTGRTPKEEAISSIWSAAFSAAGEGLPKLGQAVSPSTLNAARRGAKGYRKAQEAVDATHAAIQQTFGIDAPTAEALARSPGARRGAREAYFSARQHGFDEFSNAYDAVLKPHYGQMTPNNTWATIQQELANAKEPRVIAGTFERIPIETAPSVRVVQQVRTQVRREMRALNPTEDRELLGSLRRIDEAATKDINSRLQSTEVGRMNALDRKYGDYMAQFPARQVRAVVRAPSSPETMKAILSGKPSQINQLMRQIKLMPPSERQTSIRNLRVAFATYVHDEGSQAVDQLTGLKTVVKRIEEMPEDMFSELYGPNSRSRITAMARGAMQQHERFLKDPDLLQAVSREMRESPLPPMMRYAKHAGEWGAMYELLRGRPEEAGLLLGSAFGIGMLHKVMNNPAMQHIYLRMVTAKGAPEIAAALRALIVAGVASGGAEATKQSLGAEATGRAS